MTNSYVVEEVRQWKVCTRSSKVNGTPKSHVKMFRMMSGMLATVHAIVVWNARNEWSNSQKPVQIEMTCARSKR